MECPFAPKEVLMVLLQGAAVPPRGVLARGAGRLQLVGTARAHKILLGELPLQFGTALFERYGVAGAKLQDQRLQCAAA